MRDINVTNNSQSIEFVSRYVEELIVCGFFQDTRTVNAEHASGRDPRQQRDYNNEERR